MARAISNTSPLLYLYRIGGTDWLPALFGEVWIPPSVVAELKEGQKKGYNVPNPSQYTWLHIKTPQATPSEWFALDLGAGELAALALALENPEHVILLDDQLARHTAQAAGLTVWGTLRVLLEAKILGLVDRIEPFVDRLGENGMWLSAEVRQRILGLAQEQSSR